MDPITMIIAALTAGAVAGGQTVATDAVKDAYGGLRDMVKRLFVGRPMAEAAVENPTDDDSKEILEKHLKTMGAADNQDLIKAAQRVLAATDPKGSLSGKYVVNADHAQGVQIGNRNRQENTFNAPSAQ